MEEQKYALYVEGKDTPIGTIRDSTLGALDEIGLITRKRYRTEPITTERAREITESITKISPSSEKFFSR